MTLSSFNPSPYNLGFSRLYIFSVSRISDNSTSFELSSDCPQSLRFISFYMSYFIVHGSIHCKTKTQYDFYMIMQDKYGTKRRDMVIYIKLLAPTCRWDPRLFNSLTFTVEGGLNRGFEFHMMIYGGIAISRPARSWLIKLICKNIKIPVYSNNDHRV